MDKKFNATNENRYAIHLDSLAETAILGFELGRIALPGDVICLNGDLGAGKTTLCQSIARGLGVSEECYITSPTFAILHEYAGRIPLYHMDFYRLNDAVEVIDLGFEDYFYGEGLTVIEWSQRADTLLPEARMNLEITINDDMSREIEVSASAHFTARLENLVIALKTLIQPIVIECKSPGK